MTGKKETLSVTFPEDDFLELVFTAEQSGVTVEEFVLGALREKIGKREDGEVRKME